MLQIVETTKPQKVRLSESFLAPYREKGDCFTSLLARSTFLTKYSRGNVETWTDTIKRVVEGNIGLARGVSRREAEQLFHLIWTGQALPPGRGLWTGGVEGIPADARYNCFSGDTEFFANGVLTTLAEAVGQSVEVLAKDGQWRPAEVKSFGVQKLFTFGFKKPGQSKFRFDFEATANHRWFTKNRGEVEDLRVGDTVEVTPADTSALRDSKDFVDGFAHGFVFGDGTKETLKKGTFKVRLCGEKDRQYESLLQKAAFYHNQCSPPSYGGDSVLFFKTTSSLKDTPCDSLGLAYLTGFVEGWLAADGSYRSDPSKSSSNRLSSCNSEALDWLVKRAPLLGYSVTGRSTDPTMVTNLGVRKAPLEYLTLSKTPTAYVVESVSDMGREEEVFCVVEPETRSFTLSCGVVTGNCWYTTLYGTDDWCWVANQLMLGGGVGVGLGDIDSLPIVHDNNARFGVYCRGDHQDIDEVKPEGPSFLNGSTPLYRCEDSREGWVESLRLVLEAAFAGRDQIIDVSDVRPRGEPIKTFGGIACGPGPLVNLLRAAWNIIRGARGRRPNSVECLDITNHIGLCIKSGNVRRSALIVLGNPTDQDFRDAKKDWDAVASHRHTSNNTIAFRSQAEIDGFDWHSLVEDNIMFGEPGLLNLPLIQKTDPGARGINPCGEIPLHDREACNLAEVFPAKFEKGMDPRQAFRLITRYSLRQRMTPLLDPKADAVRAKNMRVGVGLGGLCDFDWTPELLSSWYQVCRKEADDYADELGVARPNAVTTVKPSGTISLLNSSSPGVHAPHSPFYIRRTRIAKNDPMAGAMISAGVPHEEDAYDKSGHTWVFSFPTKAPHGKVSKTTQTLRDQFQRQADIQEFWADNAVSATLNFNPEKDKEELAACLKEYVPRLKSTSCLADAHGYAQAPYEEISEVEYRAMASVIDHDNPLVNAGDMDSVQIDECQNGVCPVR